VATKNHQPQNQDLSFQFSAIFKIVYWKKKFLANIRIIVNGITKEVASDPRHFEITAYYLSVSVLCQSINQLSWEGIMQRHYISSDDLDAI